jgi:hypothetical protein
MSDIQKTIQTLRDFNLWRRADEDMDQPDPREIGQAIDAAIESMEELNELRATISDLETRHAATMLHTQSIVDEANELREQRDEALSDLEFRRNLFKLQEHLFEDVRSERDRLLEEREQWRMSSVCRELREQRDRLAEAAQAVVDRWETPFWKEVGQYHYIDSLRKALAAVEGGRP